MNDLILTLIKKPRDTKGRKYYGKDNPHFGHKLTDQQKLNISNSKKGCIPWNKGKKGLVSDESRKKMSMSHIKYLQTCNTRFTNTKPERMIKEELINRGIEYTQSVYIKQADVLVDFLIQPNIVIECDGTYWHTLPGRKERDQEKTRLLIESGYDVYRFTDTEIYSSVTDCVDFVNFQ